jgi:methylthioribose-1-phosphate isomerase
MKVQGKSMQSIWWKGDLPESIGIINQLKLPFTFETLSLKTAEEAEQAISLMQVRGAPLIGAVAAWGVYLGCLNSNEDQSISTAQQAAKKIKASRPTAVNLAWAVQIQEAILKTCGTRSEALIRLAISAMDICKNDAEQCRLIGSHGLDLIKKIADQKKGPVQILTHCNAGWLACIDYGTATSPIYLAHDQGIAVHVWVDETRPRSQGARLTAWELGQHGVPHTLIPDNAGGHLMQHGMVDLVITGTDRVTLNGDVANKIGTYLKALAAYDNQIPFYVALPSSTFDFKMKDGIANIPIEERHPSEVRLIEGLGPHGVEEFLICPESTPAANFGFDVTPARLVSGLISERGICPATEKGIRGLYGDLIHD